MSDLHINEITCNEKLLKNHLDYLVRSNCRIFIRGDIGNFITKNDRKRYARSKDAQTIDASLNEEIEYIVNFLKPYVNYIDYIGQGNHETSVIKFNSVDPAYMIVWSLNQIRDKDIPRMVCGDYKGFITLKFFKPFQETKAAVRRYIIFSHHGKGGNSPITKGMIDIQRLTMTNIAHLYWLGHKHTQIIDDTLHYETVNKNGDIVTINQVGIITAGYEKSFKANNINPNELMTINNSCYKLNWQEENFYSTNINGCMMLTIDLRNENNKILPSVESIKGEKND